MLKKIFDNKIVNAISVILEWIICILLIILIALTSFQRFSNQGSFFGYRIYTVASGSMIPTYEIGDTLLIKDMDAQDLKVGDAVTYRGESFGVNGKIITHQIQDIEVGEDGKYYFHTKGIANNIEDPIVDEDQVLGKVVYRFVTLSILCRITSNMSTLFAFSIPIAILIAIEIIKLVYKKDEDFEDEEELVNDKKDDDENDTLTSENKEDIHENGNDEKKYDNKVNTDNEKDDIILNDSSSIEEKEEKK